MHRIALVLGGARSGKSSYAERLTQSYARKYGFPVTYIATSQVVDQEMAARIDRHRTRRPEEWNTIEEPLQVSEWLRNHRQPQVVLIDCLSMLINNWMYYEPCTDEHVMNRIRDLVDALRVYENPIVIVSNEVGLGLVPPDPVSRQYRDWLGILNQSVASIANEVYYMVAGIPIDVRKWQQDALDVESHETP
jgi:adenosylcobinamide kinase / adenosylcobinamide-phosphate guanylyltransferase